MLYKLWPYNAMICYTYLCILGMLQRARLSRCTNKQNVPHLLVDTGRRFGHHHTALLRVNSSIQLGILNELHLKFLACLILIDLVPFVALACYNSLHFPTIISYYFPTGCLFMFYLRPVQSKLLLPGREAKRNKTLRGYVGS